MENDNLKQEGQCAIHDVSNSCCGWVSVKDKLPEFGKSCLVYKKNKYPQIEIASLHKISDKGGEFVIPFSACKEIEFNDAITHWQYLPNPPSARGNCC
jgi:hypothetical protein